MLFLNPTQLHFALQLALSNLDGSLARRRAINGLVLPPPWFVGRPYAFQLARQLVTCRELVILHGLWCQHSQPVRA